MYRYPDPAPRSEIKAAYREGWMDGYQKGRKSAVIDPQSDWLESDARKDTQP